mmetsp:Transcript_71942/g.192104  ORF Transcript_71942/g.192104 Transcript_71942/m.192104 type:complete len:209 (-) Transcript_71942:489-1115(-)
MNTSAFSPWQVSFTEVMCIVMRKLGGRGRSSAAYKLLKLSIDWSLFFPKLPDRPLEHVRRHFVIGDEQNVTGPESFVCLPKPCIRQRKLANENTSVKSTHISCWDLPGRGSDKKAGWKVSLARCATDACKQLRNCSRRQGRGLLFKTGRTTPTTWRRGRLLARGSTFGGAAPRADAGAEGRLRSYVARGLGNETLRAEKDETGLRSRP